MIRLQVDEREIEARPGDSLLIAMLRAGLHPTGGGCLCLGGDCPHCLVTADGVAYTRSCQTPAAAGMVVKRDHRGDVAPSLLPESETEVVWPVSAARSRETAIEPAPAHHIHCDTAVIGQGASGRQAAQEARAAGQDVVALDARQGQQVTGLYPGPLVVALDRDGRVLHVHPRREIVVATGSAEVQPVVPGSELKGLLTARAAIELIAAGIDLGNVIGIGDTSRVVLDGSPIGRLSSGKGGWDLVGFEGEHRVERVVFRRHGDRIDHRMACDTVVLGLGRQPRNALARMATDLPVRVVGSAAVDQELPACPNEGTVCPCSGVTVADLDSVWERGFSEMELLKRATLAGTGACQGGVCLPYLRSFLLDRGGRLQPAFTARPLNRQLTVRELAAGAHPPVSARSPLHDEHLRLGSRMERAGGWWRPWTYGLTQDEADFLQTVGSPGPPGPDAEEHTATWPPWTHGLTEAEREEFMELDRRTWRHGEDGDRRTRRHGEDDEGDDDLTEARGPRPRARVDDRTHEEYAVARDCVSLGDVGSLGKTLVAGPDALAFLERIVPSRVETVRPGRCRYVVLLDERGYVFDDGILCREATRDGSDRFFLTSTSGGADFLELWLRDWAEALGFDVRILNQTGSLAAINVTGPWAARLLARAGAEDLPPFGAQARLRIAGIDCRVLRLSFTGELSYELHHAVADSVDLWRRLLAVGGELSVRPHGLKTLLQLRLAKGHFIVGHDTDFDSTPRRLGCEWAVDLSKEDFVGKQAILRTNRQPLDRRLSLLWKEHVPTPERRDRDWKGNLLPFGEEARTRPNLEGSSISARGCRTGHVTSQAEAPGTDGVIHRSRARADVRGGHPRPLGFQMLGWLYTDEHGELPLELDMVGGPAIRIDRPVYDPAGRRARADADPANEPREKVRSFRPREHRVTDLAAEPPAGPPRLRPLEATRVVAAPAALDALAARPPWPDDALALRTAPDELLVAAAPDFEVAGDPHAIVERETGFSWVWLDAAAAERFLDRECEWERPSARPALAQGAVAGIPAKLRFGAERTLILVPSPFAAAFQRRLSRALGNPLVGAGA